MAHDSPCSAGSRQISCSSVIVLGLRGSNGEGGAPARVSRTSFSGVWVQHGSAGDLVPQDFVVGADMDADWKDVEVADGVFDWTGYDAQIAAAARNGFFIETALGVGPGRNKGRPGGSRDFLSGSGFTSGPTKGL